MNFFKRSLLSVWARKGKSLLQLFIFTIICLLVLSGLAIESAAKKASDLAKEKLGGEVTLQMDMEKMRNQQQSEGERTRFQLEPIPVKSAEELSTYSEVKGYNLYSSTNGIAEDFDPIENEDTSDSDEETENRGPFGENGNPMFQSDVSLQGVVFTDAVEEFMNGDSTLVEGEHITDQSLGKNVVVIEKTLADENDLTVGDTITVKGANEEEKTIELKIIGIYETTTNEQDQGMDFSFMDPYNKLYVPYTVANTLKGEDYENTIDRAVYYMKDPAEIDSFIQKAKKNSSIDFDTFKLDANDQLYNQMVGPINNVASFSKNVVYLVTISGAVILGLIVMLSIRERKYEMGVLLSLGEKRWKLIGQFVAEILIVAVLAIGISSACGNVVAGKISDQLLAQELAQQEQMNTPPSFRPGMGGSVGMRGQAANVETIDDLEIAITPKDLGMLSSIGMLIAVLSSFIPSLSVLRLHPKVILTKQD